MVEGRIILMLLAILIISDNTMTSRKTPYPLISFHPIYIPHIPFIAYSHQISGKKKDSIDLANQPPISPEMEIRCHRKLVVKPFWRITWGEAPWLQCCSRILEKPILSRMVVSYIDILYLYTVYTY